MSENTPASSGGRPEEHESQTNDGSPDGAAQNGPAVPESSSGQSEEGDRADQPARPAETTEPTGEAGTYPHPGARSDQGSDPAQQPNAASGSGLGGHSGPAFEQPYSASPPGGQQFAYPPQADSPSGPFHSAQQGYPHTAAQQQGPQFGTPQQGVPQGYPQQPGAQHPGMQQEQGYPYTYPQMGPVQSEQRSRGRLGNKLLGTFAVLAVVLGLLGGGVGGYFGYQLAASNDTPATSLDDSEPASNTNNAEPGSVQAVAQNVLPSVVQIQMSSLGGASGSGSGIVISEDGYILTNNHVAAAGQQGELVARLNDGRVAPLEVVGTAPWADLAVVKADATGLKPAKLGDSENVQVGSQVVAIGSPFGLSGTVTSGIISATDRPVRAGGESGNQSTVLNALQTDAAINPGNSGGPLVNMNGQVIGINSAIYSPSSASGQGGSVGLGFAIPVDKAKRIGKQLIEDGSATKTTLGVKISSTRGATGAAVVEVVPNSPAASANLKRGDVITKVNDRTVTSPDELIAAVRSHAPGTKVTLTVTDGQGGSERTVQAKLTGQEQ